MKAWQTLCIQDAYVLHRPMFRAAVVASAAHFAALGSLTSVRVPRPEARERMVELTIVDTPDPMPEKEVPLPGPTPTRTPTESPAPTPSPSPTPRPTPTPTPIGGIVAAADSSWSIGFRTLPPSLALSPSAIGSAPAPPRTVEPPPAPARPVSTTGGLVEALSDHDRDLGLGRGGPVVTAARDEAYRAPVPNESTATIRVLFDRDGRVVSADLVDATSGGGAWREVARAIVEALATRPLTLPASGKANGLAVTVRIVSKVRLPSGARPDSPVSAGAGGLIFDLSDIGAKPRRVISAHIVEERPR